MRPVLPCDEAGYRGHLIKASFVSVSYTHLDVYKRQQLNAVSQLAGVTDVKVMKPILAVASNRNAKLPFHSAAEMLAKGIFFIFQF